MPWTSLINSGLRAVTLISRFALTIFLAKLLSVRSLGEFGLINAMAAMAPAVISIGLHYRLNREIVGRPIVESGHRIRDRLLVHLVPFSIICLIPGIVYVSGTELSIEPLNIVLAIVVMEVLSSDIYLSLISLRRPTFANALLYIKNASWVLPYLGIAYAFPGLRNLDCVLKFWLASFVIMFAVLGIGLRSWPWREINQRRVDLKWVFTDFRTAFLIYLGDLGIVGSQFADRFVVNAVLGLSDTGIFVFYWNLANGVQQLMTIGLIQPALPKLIDAARNEDDAEFRALILRELRILLLAAIGFAIAVFTATAAAIPLIGRDALAERLWILPALLLGVVIKLASDLLNYGMYAKKQDTQLALINLTSAGVSTLLTFISLRFLGLSGIGAASIGTATYTLLLRIYNLRHTLFR